MRYTEGIYCIYTKSLFGNNSGKSEMEILQRDIGHVARHCKLLAPSPERAQNGAEKNSFCELWKMRLHKDADLYGITLFPSCFWYPLIAANLSASDSLVINGAL